MNELSLFSGYGGFSLGLRLAGLQTRTVAYVEWDKYPQEIIKARIKDRYLDDAPIFSDISSFRGEQFRGMVDIITAGFPCQPHSVAGLQRGANDDRNKWPDTLRVIREVGPRWVILENVPGLLSAPTDGGRPAYGGTVVGELASIGYSVHWQTLGADDVGAPHRRKRWWCIAVADGSSPEPTTHTRNYGEERGVSEEERKEYGSAISERGSRNVADSEHDGFVAPTVRASEPGAVHDRGAEGTDSTRQSEGIRPPGNAPTQLADSGYEGLEGGIRNPGGEERQTSEEIGYNRDRVRSEAGCGDGTLADSDSNGSRQDNQPPQLWASGTEQSSRDSGLPGEGEDGEVQRGRWAIYPTWPPSPNDTDGWERVIRERPDLAPALSKEAESQFRGMDDGRSRRVDELKACGNGIVPAVLAEFLQRVLR